MATEPSHPPWKDWYPELSLWVLQQRQDRLPSQLGSPEVYRVLWAEGRWAHREVPGAVGAG